MSRSLFDKHRFAPVFILSLIVVIAAQIHFSLLHSNFKISVGIICFPVFLCLLDNVSLIPVSVLSGLGVFLARLCFHSYEIGGARNAFTACYPEIFFYISYGILLNFYAGKHKPFYDMPISLLPFFLMDYGANICELVMRSDVPFFSLRIHLWMLVVAVMRSLLVVLCLYLFRQYHQVLVRNEHAERYRKLMSLLLYGQCSSSSSRFRH